MRIQLLSDLHFEFHADSGACFPESMAPAGVDVLILAGDIAVGDGIPSALSLLCRRYEHAKVVYVHGNHEFYDSDRAAVLESTRQAVAANANLVWLDGDCVDISGVRFLGAPLWFRPAPHADRVKRSMCDFP